MPNATSTPCASSASTSACAAVRTDVWDAAIPASLLPEREDVRGDVVRVGAADQAGGHRTAAVLDLVRIVCVSSVGASSARLGAAGSGDGVPATAEWQLAQLSSKTVLPAATSPLLPDEPAASR